MKGWRSALVLAFALAGCGPGSATSNEPFTPEGVAALSQLSIGTVRRWTDFYGTEPVTLTEQMIVASDGSWSDRLLTLNGKSQAQLTTSAEIDEFTALERELAGGKGRYAVTGRDFRIRDWNAFLANYDWNLISSTESVAGRPVYVADVWATTHDRPRYMLWVDQETLLTLKCLEFLATGELATEMEVLSVDWNPSLDGVVLTPVPQNLAVHSEQFASSVGFQTFQLAYVPAGFQLDSAKLSTIQGHTLLTQSFTDGVLELTFAQYADPNAPEVPGAISVRTNYWGPLARTKFAITGTQVHVNAKLTRDEFMNVVESITPNP